MDRQPPLNLDQISPEDWEHTPDSIKQLVESLLAQAVLPLEDQQVRQFLDASPIGIAVHYHTGQIIYLNHAGRALLGIDRSAELRADLLSEVFQIYREGTEILYPAEELPVIRALAGEAIWADDLEVRTPQRVLLLEVWASPIVDNQGQVTYVVVVFQDVSDRKRREMEQRIISTTLAENERHRRQVIEVQTDLILQSLPDTTIIFANDAVCNALQRPLQQVLGLKWNDFVPPEDLPILQARLAELTPEQPTFESINRNYRANGQTSWTQWVNLGIFDDQRQLVKIQSVGRDITALQAQILREQALNRVFQAIRNSLDLDTIFTTAVRETAQLLGELDCSVVQYLPTQGIWKHIAQFCHEGRPSALGMEIPDAGNPFADQLKQLQIVRLEDMTNLEDVINQDVARTLPGAWLLIPLVVNGSIWGSFTITTPEHPFNWQEEQVSLAQAVARQLEVAIHQANLYKQLQLELAERQRVEMALRESEARFQNMAANVPGAIFRYVLHPDGTDSVLYMSAGCARLWEVEAQAVIEDASILWKMIHPDDLPTMQASVMESARMLQPWFHAWRITTPSGREKWLEAAGRPTRQANGDIIWDTLILDVTDRKQAELALEASEAQYRQLIETANEGVWIIDAENKTSFVNAKMADMLGYSIDEMLGQSLFAFMNVTEVAIAEQHLERCRQGISEQHDFKFQHKNGDDVWTLIATSPIVDEHHRYQGTLGMLTDITDRKRTEAALERSEQRFRTLFEATPKIAIRGYNRHRQVIYWNHASELLYGYTKTEAIGQQLEDLIIPPEIRDQVIAAIDQWTTQGQVMPAAELQLMHKDGSRVAVYSSHMMLMNADKEPELYSVDIDLRDRNQAEAARRESEARYRLLAENTNDLVCLHGVDGRYLYVSPSCETLLGYHYNEMLGQDPYTFAHPDDRDRIRQEAHRAAVEGKSVPITYRMLHKAGHYLWFETLTKPIVDASGQVVQIQTTSRDVTERVLAQQQLEHDAYHDALTGLPNRQLMMERLTLAVNRAQQSPDYHFAVLFLDLDRFKVINDSLGHLAGDQLLIAIAQRLQAVLRNTDLAARLGGDEFVILLDDIHNVQDAVRATERLFTALQTPFELQGRQVYTSCSIGIVFGTSNYTQASELLRDADIAMYQAKGKGRTQYEIFDAQMHIQALNRLYLENDLQRAIDCQEFVVHYQPIVALDTGAVAGLEALIRWQHPTQGLKTPGTFISVAEEIGLITRLDYWVLQTACHQLATWQALSPHLSSLEISVNLCTQDLKHGDLLSEVDRVLETTGIDSQCLTLEITESMLIDDLEATIDRLHQLKARGVQISIDDFGTGYSSLSYLHQLPIDSLKVDRSFVQQIALGQRNRQLVETIAALGQQLGLDTIAEGIETQQQLERLQQLGYQYGQRYWFSRPLAEPEATTLLLQE